MALLAAGLSSFLVVARTGHVTAAARQLGLSQPALTKQMKALEASLGVALLERAGRGIRLTAAGEVLASYARRGAALLDEAGAVLAEMATGHAGRLSLGAGVTTSILNLPTWLRRFHQARPRVELSVRTGPSQTVERWVLEREVDAGFVTSETKHPDLVVTRVHEEQIILCAARGKPVRAPVELARVPLILFPRGTGFRSFLEAKLGASGHALEARMESDSLEAIKAFVTAGLGAAFLPATTIKRELARGTLRKLTARNTPKLIRHTTLLRRADRPVPAPLRFFLGVVRAG